MPQAKRPHGEYVGISVNLFAAAYNTNLVKADEVPKSYADLTDPKWKGRLAIEADDVPWFAAIVSAMGEDKGLKLFKDIVQTNGLSARKGHTLLANMVGAGEVPLALTVFSYKSDQLQRAGAPVRTLLSAAGDRAGDRHLGVALRTTSACRGAVLRLHAGRGAGDFGETRPGSDQSHDHAAAGRPHLDLHGPRRRCSTRARSGPRCGKKPSQSRSKAGATNTMTEMSPQAV